MNIVYKIKSVDDDGYVTVEVNSNDIVVHPTTKKKSIINDNYIFIPKDDRFHTKNIHSTRCRCNKCSDMLKDIFAIIKERNIPVVVLTSKEDKS